MAQTFPGTETASTGDTSSTSTADESESAGGTLRVDAVKDLGNMSENFEEAFGVVVKDIEDSTNSSSNIGNNEEGKEDVDEFTSSNETLSTEIGQEDEDEDGTEEEEKETTEFEKRLDLEKHGYTPSIFHALFPLFGMAYH